MSSTILLASVKEPTGSASPFFIALTPAINVVTAAEPTLCISMLSLPFARSIFFSFFHENFMLKNGNRNKKNKGRLKALLQSR